MKQEAEVALPPGWTLERSDHERFSAGRKKVDVFSAAATAPDGSVILTVGLDEDAAYRLLARAFAGEVDPTDGWVLRVRPQ